MVSEKLSQHVLANYGKFVQGVEEVARVELDLQAAHTTTKLARERLALALREVRERRQQPAAWSHSLASFGSRCADGWGARPESNYSGRQPSSACATRASAWCLVCPGHAPTAAL